MTMAIDRKMARGIVLMGFFTSPAEAAMAEKPKNVINTIAAVPPMRTISVLNFSASSAARTLPSPPTTNQISSTTLAAVTTT